VSSIVVRHAERGDEPAIAAVSESGVTALRRVYRPTPEALARYRRMPALPRLVALIDGTVVGTVEYSLGDELLHLMGLYVAESHRRRGVARALIDELARIAGNRPVTLDTIRQTGNVPIFERLGFAVLHEAPAEHVESISGEPLVDVLLERAP
jgi:ribosomal protein S18 acetylase RimI-like enzyme